MPLSESLAGRMHRRPHHLLCNCLMPCAVPPLHRWTRLLRVITGHNPRHLNYEYYVAMTVPSQMRLKYTNRCYLEYSQLETSPIIPASSRVILAALSVKPEESNLVWKRESKKIACYYTSWHSKWQCARKLDPWSMNPPVPDDLCFCCRYPISWADSIRAIVISNRGKARVRDRRFVPSFARLRNPHTTILRTFTIASTLIRTMSIQSGPDNITPDTYSVQIAMMTRCQDLATLAVPSAFRVYDADTFNLQKGTSRWPQMPC